MSPAQFRGRCAFPARPHPFRGAPESSSCLPVRGECVHPLYAFSCYVVWIHPQRCCVRATDVTQRRSPLRGAAGPHAPANLCSADTHTCTGREHVTHVCDPPPAGHSPPGRRSSHLIPSQRSPARLVPSRPVPSRGCVGRQRRPQGTRGRGLPRRGSAFSCCCCRGMVRGNFFIFNPPPRSGNKDKLRLKQKRQH